jgi:hypothetical protein
VPKLTLIAALVSAASLAACGDDEAATADAGADFDASAVYDAGVAPDGEPLPDAAVVAADATPTYDAEIFDAMVCPMNDPDSDDDGVCDSADVCDGFDDSLDDDNDTVPDGCDACAGFADNVDTDGDGVPNGCEQCEGHDDNIDANSNNIPDGCEDITHCDPAIEVEHEGICYYLDGSGGACAAGYELAPQSVLAAIAPRFVGKDYRTQVSDNCCISHADQATEGQDWGFEDPGQCNAPGPFATAPLLDGASCTDANNNFSAQLTLCREQVCDPATEVYHGGRCYYLDGSGSTCEADFALGPQSVLDTIAGDFVGRDYRTQVSDNCCIAHADQIAEGQDWGMGSPDCNATGPFQTGPELNASACFNSQNNDPMQLTLCESARCDPATEVEYNGRCYHLDGSGGQCGAGYIRAPQSILTVIATDFVGKTYKNQVSDNCCIGHADEQVELQDWGMGAPDCNGSGPFQTGPELGGQGCDDVLLSNPAQLTLCVTF